MDSCNWVTDDIQFKYHSWNSAVAGAQIHSRWVGGKSILLEQHLGPDGELTIDLPSISTVILGLAYYFTQVPASDWQFCSITGSANSVAFGAGLNNGFYITVNGTTYHSADDLISALTWMHTEIKIVTHPTAGTVQVRLNEVLIIDESGLNTGELTEDYDFIKWNTNDAFDDLWLQDIWICDDTGSKNNDFLGDKKVEITRPNANGDTNNFIPSAGANWENVDEEAFDDATFNVSTIITDKDLYNHTDVSLDAGVSILGVQQFTILKKTDVEIRNAKQVLKSGTTEDLSDEYALNLSYTGYRRLFDVDPDTLTDWTETALNAVQSGVVAT